MVNSMSTATTAAIDPTVLSTWSFGPRECTTFHRFLTLDFSGMLATCMPCSTFLFDLQRDCLRSRRRPTETEDTTARCCFDLYAVQHALYSLCLWVVVFRTPTVLSA